MKWLVTGGAGFIGSNFVFYMLDKYPEDQIICLDKLTYAGNLETLEGVMENPGFTFVKGDIADREAVYALFERALLFDITFMVVSFWMLFGYTMNEVFAEEPFLCPVTVRSRMKRTKEPAGALPALTRRTGNDII